MARAKKQVEYSNSPVAWFCVLERARKDGDSQREAEAKRNLRRLGVDVRFATGGRS